MRRWKLAAEMALRENCGSGNCFILRQKVYLFVWLPENLGRNVSSDHDISPAQYAKGCYVQGLMFIACFAFKIPLPDLCKNRQNLTASRLFDPGDHKE
jgi:hypothetical protein